MTRSRSVSAFNSRVAKTAKAFRSVNNPERLLISLTRLRVGPSLRRGFLAWARSRPEIQAIDEGPQGRSLIHGDAGQDTARNLSRKIFH